MGNKGYFSRRQLEKNYDNYDLTRIKRLDVSDRAISQIDEHTFEHLSNLRELKMNMNHLKYLGYKTFAGLSNLVDLELDNNQLGGIDTLTFKDLTSLARLSLSCNRLAWLDTRTFQDLFNLKELNLASNMLSCLEPLIFYDLVNLTTLDLSFNSLYKLENLTFSQLRFVRELYLNNNQLTVLNQLSFVGLKSLQKLDLSQNKLESIEAGAFRELTDLESLKLDHNQLKSLKDNTFEVLKKLKFLVLNNNNLTSISAETFASLDALTQLWLNYNRLTSIPDNAFRSLASLNELFLHHNELDVVGENSFTESIKLISMYDNRKKYASYVCDHYFEAKTPQTNWQKDIVKSAYTKNYPEFIDQFKSIESEKESNRSFWNSASSDSNLDLLSRSYLRFDSFSGRKLKEDRYEIKGFLGLGQFGKAYLASDSHDKIEKVIKFKMIIGLEEKDINEIGIISQLDSQYVIKYYEHFKDDVFVYLVIEYCKNRDLMKLIVEHQETNREISLSRVFEWTVQTAKGLEYLHSMNIVHRDLKPNCLFLTESMKIKIGNFSYAEILDKDQDSDDHLSGKNGLTVSPEYMSPEMIKLNQYTFNTDVWSLGCVVYELLFLKKAFPLLLEDRSSETLNYENSIFTSILKRMLKNDNLKRPSSSELCSYLVEMERKFFDNDDD